MSVVFTAIVATVFILTLTKRGLNMLKFGLGLLLGGAFSNTYDRIKKGYVTDYMVFEHAPGFLKNVVFNLSDFAIIIGALISALQ
jgi:signal peptidase II